MTAANYLSFERLSSDKGWEGFGAPRHAHQINRIQQTEGRVGLFLFLTNFLFQFENINSPITALDSLLNSLGCGNLVWF